MSFDLCDAFREYHEGGTVSDPDDLGGFTAYGLAVRFWGKRYPDFFANPTPTRAREIFFVEFYLANSVGRLPPHYQVVYYDLLVNHSPDSARRIFQRGLGGGLKIDGKIGPRTLARADADANRIPRIMAARCEHYHRRVIENASQRRFIRGWFHRAVCLAVYATGVRAGIPFQPNGKMPGVSND